MHRSRAGADLGTSFDGCGEGRGSVCHMRMAQRERRIGTCQGVAGEEEAPTGGTAGMAFAGADGRWCWLGGGELADGIRWRLQGGRGIRLALLLSLVGRSVLNESQSGTVCK
jgi:hypothetical protein